MAIVDDCKAQTARKPQSACRSIYAKGCNTASVAIAANHCIFNRRTGKNAALTSLQHLATPTRPPVLSSTAYSYHQRFCSVSSVMGLIRGFLCNFSVSAYLYRFIPHHFCHLYLHQSFSRALIIPRHVQVCPLASYRSVIQIWI